MKLSEKSIRIVSIITNIIEIILAVCLIANCYEHHMANNVWMEEDDKIFSPIVTVVVVVVLVVIPFTVLNMVLKAKSSKTVKRKLDISAVKKRCSTNIFSHIGLLFLLYIISEKVARNVVIELFSLDLSEATYMAGHYGILRSSFLVMLLVSAASDIVTIYIANKLMLSESINEHCDTVVENDGQNSAIESVDMRAEIETKRKVVKKFWIIYAAILIGALLKEVRINNLEEWIYDKTERSWKEDLYPLDKKFTQTTLGLQGINGLISVVQDIIVYLILAFEVIYSTMTVGDFSMYLTAAGTFSNLVTGISTNYSYLMLQTAWYLKEYRHCLAIAESMKEEGNTHIDIPENVEIEFRDVSFKYPKTERMILEHVNITIGRGETLSIVGVNGAGKTTFVKLLCRFYEPTSGEIFVGGIPARDIPLNEYYRLLGVVFQDFSLFNFTVRENIAMDTECDEERLRDAVTKCGLESRMETLPHGADTYIYKEFDPDGIELSGGEGQKIAIARAVYRGAPIVIFDEPTSALDPIAEYDIYRNFHDLAQNRTAIYISHRLSSTRFTDKTAVFANGTIAEYGTHAELMQIDGGIYKDMFSMQAKYYKE